MLFRTIVNSTKILFLYLLIRPPSPKIKIPQNSNLGGIRFGIDEEGNYGYKKVGEDIVIPFSSGRGLTLVGSYSGNQIIDVSKFVNDNANSNNFVCVFRGVNSTTSNGDLGNYSERIRVFSRINSNAASWQYNVDNKTLIINGMTVSATAYINSNILPATATATINYDVYYSEKLI